MNTVAFPTLKASGPYRIQMVSCSRTTYEFSVKDGSCVEGGKQAMAVMVEDAKIYASKGGGGFQVWVGGDPSKPLTGDAPKPCFVCHTPQKAQDNTFSAYIP